MASLVYLTNKTNGKTYVYVNEKSYDGSGGYRRRCIGHLDPDTGQIVPNREKKASSGPRVASSGVNSLVGHVSKECGLTSALQITFPSSWRLILSCSMFLLAESSPLAFIEQWSASNVTPFSERITHRDLESLLGGIESGDMEAFMRIWAKKVDDREVVAVISDCMDLSNIGPFGLASGVGNIGFMSSEVELHIGRESGIPISYCYRTVAADGLAASGEYLENAEWMDSRSFMHVMGAEDLSDSELDSMLSGGEGRILVLSSDSSMAKQVIAENSADVFAYGNYYSGPAGEHGFIKEIRRRIGGRMCRILVAYNEGEAEKRMGSFLNLIDCCRVEIETGRRVVEHAPFYDSFFNGTEVDSNKVMEHASTTGYTVLVTNSDMKKDEVLEWYRCYMDTGGLFSYFRNNADVAQYKLYMEHNFESRVFIQFVTSILYREIRNRLIKTNLAGDTTVSIAMREMYGVMDVYLPGAKKPVMSELNYRQRIIMDAMGVNRR